MKASVRLLVAELSTRGHGVLVDHWWDALRTWRKNYRHGWRSAQVEDMGAALGDPHDGRLRRSRAWHGRRRRRQRECGRGRQCHVWRVRGRHSHAWHGRTWRGWWSAQVRDMGAALVDSRDGRLRRSRTWHGRGRRGRRGCGRGRRGHVWRVHGQRVRACRGRTWRGGRTELRMSRSRVWASWVPKLWKSRA